MDSPAPLDVLHPPLQGCGNCCMQIGRPPFMVHTTNDPRPERVRLVARQLPIGMPDSLVDEVESYIADVLHGRTPDRAAAGMPCFWLDLDTRLCRHYEFRPKVCRECDCEEGSHDCTLLPPRAGL